jgi:hypothetical protein
MKVEMAVAKRHCTPHGAGNKHHVQREQARLFDVTGKLDQLFETIPQTADQAGHGTSRKFADTM